MASWLHTDWVPREGEQRGTVGPREAGKEGADMIKERGDPERLLHLLHMGTLVMAAREAPVHQAGLTMRGRHLWLKGCRHGK